MLPEARFFQDLPFLVGPSGETVPRPLQASLCSAQSLTNGGRDGRGRGSTIMIGTNTYEIPAGLRGIAEAGLDQSRRAFDGVFAAARSNAEMLQGATDAARSNTLAMAARGFDYAEQNVRAALDYAQKLAGSRDLREAMQVQAEFVRDRFGALQSQARTIGGLAQNATQQGAEQAKAAVQENQQRFQKIAEQNQEAVNQAAEASGQAASDVVN